MKKKIVLISIYVLTLALFVAAGNTLAWLIDTSGEPLVNVFAPSNIDVELKETTTNYKMIPGNTITKDPTVTVDKKSEDCWVFVKVVENLGDWATYGGKFTDYLSYTIDSGWTPLAGVPGVYYREVSYDADNDQSFAVITGNAITVSNDTVTKEMMDKLYITGAQNPTLAFTAYAVQKANVDTPAEAWALVNP